MFLKRTYLFLLFSLFLSFSFIGAQSAKQKELEVQRQQKLKEIKQINALLFSNKKEQKSVITLIEDLNYKISVRKNLIRITNEQANLLTREINSNQKEISNLRTQLQELKDDYAAMIVKSYKSKSEHSRIMFLLSSESFFQAYRRIQYIKQFAVFRKKQANKIVGLINEIGEINKELNFQKTKKEELLNSNRAIQKSLESEKKESSILAHELRRQEKKYRNEIDKKQRLSLQIDKEIERLIREAIAKSNKEKNKSDSFDLTPEAKELSKNFVLNKGKLPWPVIRGVVIQKFGTQPHPVVKTAKIKSNGIIIATATKSNFLRIAGALKDEIRGRLNFQMKNGPSIGYL